ncbi:uncharacterized protein LOC119673897 [Teleopsis dalmanni]|uniref:uncharacterized protein LOC119673897 n=1 Tax=Teleopsis dalmanni TaxID=139649 RepID=UPI0018CF8056|nr:uncharacterized protein LOC119673897 [Teleopsis dalmanni]
MLLKIRHALLEINNYPNPKLSAIIINNEIIITSGCILKHFVRPLPTTEVSDSSEGACPSTKIIRKLERCEIISTQDGSDEAQHLNALSYQVTFDRQKLPATARNQQPRILTRYCARPLYMFSSNEITRQFHNFLQNAAVQVDGHNDVLLSSFLVLTMRTTREQEKFERFLYHIGHYLRYLHPIRPLDDVLAMCTPFGEENFYKSISIGKVSNVIGRDGSLFVVSNALPQGCEGSAVFNNKLRLIGVIICTTFMRNDGNVNFTIAASFAYLLRDFMKQLGVKITSITVPREPSNFSWERAMVAIVADGNQGTGTFVRVQQKKFILTCSHVLYQNSEKVHCRSIDGVFESDVLWHNPHSNQAFDVALLSAPSNIPNRYFVRLSSRKPSLGLQIYNAGFPYFANVNFDSDFNPSIFQGRIIKCSTGAIVTDGCVQAGQSGGPVFDENGCVLGICIANTKIDNVIYPNINTAVPICDIRLILENFAKTNDITVLNNLVANDEIQRVWSLQTPPILSKL